MTSMVAITRRQEDSDLAVLILDMRKEIGAMRQEISARLDQSLVSTSGLDKRILAIENSFLLHVNTRLDNLETGVMTTHLDIQSLALEIDQGHDRVFASVNHVRGAVFDIVQESHKQTHQTIDVLSKSLVDSNEKTRNSFLEIGQSIDSSRGAVLNKLDTAHKEVNSTICNKIDNANGNVNQNILDSRDHVCDKMRQVQQEVGSSRRRINEKINLMHEAIAGLLHDTRDIFTHKMDQVTVILTSTLSALREIRKSCPSTGTKKVNFPGESLIDGSVRDPDTDVDSETSKKKKKRLEFLKISKY
ncbi:hypothetical protein E4U21_000849 [Claviceps maximensis]|nr:hypothetical protein E4U21_000849 [Claviceps maximensis]